MSLLQHLLDEGVAGEFLPTAKRRDPCRRPLPLHGLRGLCHSATPVAITAPAVIAESYTVSSALVTSGTVSSVSSITPVLKGRELQGGT
jgi:hypothetical protein